MTQTKRNPGTLPAGIPASLPLTRNRRVQVLIQHPGSATMEPVLKKDPQSLMTDEAADAYVAALPCPAGWTVIGCIQCSVGPRGGILPTDPRALRVTLVPTEWVDDWQPQADLGVYVAAQYAGLRTRLDDYLSAVVDIGCYAAHLHDPDGRPLMRLPVNVPEALAHHISLMQSIARRRQVGYGWGRPDNGYVQHVVIPAEQDSDEARWLESKRAILEWVSCTHPTVLAAAFSCP
jgi:hypothetical protein